MKRNKTVFILLLVIGIPMLLFGTYVFVDNYLKVENIQEFDETKTYNNEKVIIRGNIHSESSAKDDDFNVFGNSAILIRDTQMVQWYQEDNEVKYVFSNTPIGSFMFDGTEYKNPIFDSDTSSMNFFGDVKAGNVSFDLKTLRNIVDNKSVSRVVVEDIPDNSGLKYGLVKYENGYATKGDDWTLGDIKITYYEIKDEVLKDLIIYGTIDDGVLTGGKVLTGNENIETMKMSLIKAKSPYILIAGVGLILIIVAFVTKPKKKKKVAI